MDSKQKKLAIVEFLMKEGCRLSNIHRKPQNIYGDDTLDKTNDKSHYHSSPATPPPLHRRETMDSKQKQPAATELPTKEERREPEIHRRLQNVYRDDTNE